MESKSLAFEAEGKEYEVQIDPIVAQVLSKGEKFRDSVGPYISI